MSVTLSLDPPGSTDLDPGFVSLSRQAMDSLGVTVGDVLELRGRRRTPVRVAGPHESGSDTLRIRDPERQNLGTDYGDTVAVERIDPPTAERVTLAPAQELSIRGGGDALRPVLEGRAVVTGDRIPTKLFRGSLSVTFVVTGTAPEGPVSVAKATEIVVEEGPASLPDPRGAGAGLGSATFEDIGGRDGTIERLRQLVEVPLRHPELFDRLGNRAPNGVLLHGPAGTGKTMLISALVNAFDPEVIELSSPDRIDELYGAEWDLDAVVREATEGGPTLVVLDGIGSFLPPRSEGTSTERRALRRVIALLDALADVEGVVTVGATQDAEGIDDALRRGGRFDREIELDVPDRDARRAILELQTEGLPLADDVDLDDIAARAHGFVGADLDTLVTEAVGAAAERLPTSVTLGAERISGEVLADVEVTAADFETALRAVDPSAMRDVVLERPDVTYNDVGGLIEAKRELVRAIEWPLQYPQLFERLRSTAPQGILLYGAPGTGKTLLAKAVANSTEANFISVKGPELLNRYVGESERAVREVFKRARQNAPSILFFDEVDALAPRREGDSDSGAVERVVSQLLTELDGMEPREGVVVIGATNRPDMVDRALLRPGRFEKTVHVPIPDREAREEIFSIHTRDIPLSGIDPADLADRTTHYTGSDIAAVVREASLLAMEAYLTEHSFEPSEASLEELRIHPEHFDRALETVSPSVTDEMRRQYEEIAGELGE